MEQFTGRVWVLGDDIDTDIIIPTEYLALKTIEDMKQYVGKVDVMILCGGSATDLPEQSVQAVKLFNTVDSFDTHANIPAYFEKLDAAAKESGNIGAMSIGWDPGLFSLARIYFGSALAPDDDIQYEWARIPHFYRAFYVYQYATGYSAATAISAKILAEGETARKNYIEFLKSGSSNDPVELLKIAGVDMSSPEPIRMAMETFKGLVEELEQLMQA